MRAGASTSLLRLHDPRTAVGLALVGLGVFAYRALLAYDPGAAVRPQSADDEAFFFEPTGGSPTLIFAVFAWMLWRRRHRLAASLGAEANAPVVLLLLLPAIGLGLWAHHVQAIDLLIPSLALSLLGGGALLGGNAGLRAVLLPALFLAFAIPIPPVLMNWIVFPLQLGTAEFTNLVLGVLGITSVVSGDHILTGGRVFQVIETCSGMRLMHTLAMAAVVYAELLQRPRPHAVLLLLLAPLVGVVINVIRVLSIVLNPYSSFAAVHTTQGLVMLVVGVLVLSVIDRALEAWLPGPPVREPAVPAAPALPGLSVGLFAAWLVLLGTAPLWLPSWNPPPSRSASAYQLPLVLGEWQSESLRVDETFLGSVGFSERIARRYRHGDDQVDLFLGQDARLERARSPLSEKTLLPGSGWEIEERVKGFMPWPDPPVESVLVRSPTGTRLVLHWRDGVEPLAVEALRSILSLDRGPFRRPGRATVVRLSTPVNRSAPSGRAEAEARLRSFAPLARDAIASLGGSRLGT